MQKYDPTTVNGSELSAPLKKLFRETRERYLKETADIAIAHQGFRLRELERMYRNVGRNAELGAKLLEQAAKEVGGMFSNVSRRELTGKNGAPVAVEMSFENWSVEEMEAFSIAGRAGLEALRHGRDPRELVAAELAREKQQAAG